MILENRHIDMLLQARNEILAQRDLEYTPRSVNLIDAVLRDIPIGARADVDAALGRNYKRVMVQHVDGTVEVDPAWLDEQYAAAKDWEHIKGDLAL